MTMAQHGSDNKEVFIGSAMQFMQAGQNMAQQFMDFIGKAGNPAGSAPPARSSLPGVRFCAGGSSGTSPSRNSVASIGADYGVS